MRICCTWLLFYSVHGVQLPVKPFYFVIYTLDVCSASHQTFYFQPCFSLLSALIVFIFCLNHEGRFGLPSGFSFLSTGKSNQKKKQFFQYTGQPTNKGMMGNALQQDGCQMKTRCLLFSFYQSDKWSRYLRSSVYYMIAIGLPSLIYIILNNQD